MRSPMSEYWRSMGKSKQPNRQRRPEVTIREMAVWHPGSVYESLLARANWINSLNISHTAKTLTRLRGKGFRVAVERLIASQHMKTLCAGSS